MIPPETADDPASPPPSTAETPARPAASLLVLREAGGGVEVLMGMRGAGHRFMPNRLVFPGGAVDPGDADAPAASELAPPVAARLAAHAEPRLARALAMAAARELEEETSLSLGQPPALAGLDVLCRAVTPPASPIRFDAFFFVVRAAEVAGSIAGSGELEGLRYYGLDEAEALDLAFVTGRVLGRLRHWLSLDAAARAARPGVPVMRERTWHEA